MPSFYDLMKYAKTGIASPDMTGFDKLRARAAFGGYPVSTITGIPPISFKADGTPLTAWSIAGNMVQDGTPAPDAPIMPEFVGVRTGNLFDKGAADVYNAYIANNGKWLTSEDSRSVRIKVEPSTQYTLSVGESLAIFRIYEAATTNPQPNDNVNYIEITRNENISMFTFTTGGSAAWVIFQGSASGVDRWLASLMLNPGSTALPYEPYGWAEKITCAGQTVPIYLGQVQTVRWIKKLVLTGEEAWWTSGTYTGATYAYHSQFPGIKPLTPIFCTHLVDATLSSYVQGTCKNDTNSVGLWMFDTTTSPTAFKAYLAAQYANGTPVTVWYVLATPQTAIVNEPLAKIGDYADELHSTDAGVTIPTAKGANVLTVDTELPPSAVSVTGHIKAI